MTVQEKEFVAEVVTALIQAQAKERRSDERFLFPLGEPNNWWKIAMLGGVKTGHLR